MQFKSSFNLSHFPPKTINYLLGAFLFIVIPLEKLEGYNNADQEIIKQLDSIQSLEGKGTFLLLNTYKLSATSPQQLLPTLMRVRGLFPNNFLLKKPLMNLSESEVDFLNGDYEKALAKINQAIHILENKPKNKVAFQKILCLGYIFLSKISKYTKNEHEGLIAVFKALEIAQKINFPAGKFLAHNHIGILNGYFTDNLSLSLTHYQKAQAVIPQTPHYLKNYFNLSILNNLAINWAKTGEVEKCINYQLEIIKKLDGFNYNSLSIATNNNLGSNYFKLAKYDLSEKYLLVALDLMKKHKRAINKGIPLLKLGFIKMETGQLKEAKSYCNKIDQWLTEYNFIKKHERSFYKLRGEIAKAEEDYEMGIFWYEKAASVQLYLKESAINMTFLKNKYELIDIHQSIESLKKAKEIHEHTIRVQRVKIWGLILLSILVVTFSSVMFYQKKKLKEAYDFILKEKKKGPKIKATIANKPNVINKELKEKITQALEKEKLYLDADLTLNSLANHLNSNTSYISKTINVGYGKNFNALINEYRVKAFLSFVDQGQTDIYTIEALYSNAGFKSKSSFQKAFKVYMGVTASYYINSLKRKT